MSRLLYHMAKRSEWEQAEAEGLYHGSADDRRDGFLHFSTDQQVAESAAKHRAGQTDLLLIVVAEEGAGPWKWEVSRGGALFPHLYGPLPVSVALGIHELPLGPNGLHIFPPFV